jgi:hypothetical protein
LAFASSAQPPASSPSQEASTSPTPAQGQTSQTPTQIDGSGSTPQPDSKKQKRVWTNENLADANGPVSVVGNAKSTAKTKSGGEKPVDAQYVANTKKQIEKLQGQIDDAEKQLQQLKDFSKGEPSPSNGVQLHKSYDRDPIDVQIRGLQDKKKQYQEKIDALLEEARKKGVEPGQLR